MKNTESFNRFILEQVKSGAISGDTAVQIIRHSESLSREDTDNKTAIIGFAGRLPGAADMEEFWENIKNGTVSVGRIPAVRSSYAEELAKDGRNQGMEYDTCAYLDEIDHFDYEFFGIPPREAYCMEPAQRILMEVATQAIENSGIGCQRIKGTNTGIYVGRDHTSGREIYDITSDGGIFSLVGTYTSILASRISYFLNLKGPAIVMDTACSSSLVALHTACTALKNKECDMALVAGVNIFPLGLAKGAMGEVRSEEGVTRAFDNRADGSMWGEAVGAILLKPYEKAMKDHDNIMGVILGSAVNSDGTSNGLTAPSAKAQTEVLKKAWAQAGIRPDEIDYIETHGTGTKIGDPIEIEGITNAFRASTSKKQFCGIGSVKGNVGHTVGASGMVSLLKMLLALQHKIIPGNSGFEIPNQFIPFYKSAVYVNKEPCRWETNGHPRTCGISSFGFSGTNCHVILQEAESGNQKNQEDNEDYIFVLSARTREALAELVLAYQKELRDKQELDVQSICSVAALGRGHYRYRLACVCRTIQELEEKLNKVQLVAEDRTEEKVFYYGEHEIIRVKSEKKNRTEKYESEIRELTVAVKAVVTRLSEHQDRKQSLEQICEYYVAGASIDWNSIFEEEKTWKMSLPVYPFQKLSCKEMKTNTYYRLEWQEAEERQAKEKKDETTLVILVGAESKEFGEFFIKDGEKKIICHVKEQFACLGKNTYETADEIESYCQMFGIADMKQVTKIIYLASEETITPMTGYNLAKALGKKEALSLRQIQFVIRQKRADKTELYIEPNSAALIGTLKVMDTEFPNIECRCICYCAGTELQKIAAELEADKTHGEFVVLFHKNKKYAQVMREYSFPQPVEQKTPVLDGNTYLITGGTGGLGLLIAQCLAEYARVNLILISRKFQKTDKQVKAIRKMELCGCQVKVYEADCSKKPEMEAVYEKVKSEFGVVNGVIHCAGIFDEKLLIEKRPSDFREALVPKINGVMVLDEITGSEPLDFLITFSSIASFIGMLGQGAYSAANSFLDAYAKQRNALGKRTININWGTWSQSGGALSFGTNVDGMFLALSDEEGKQYFKNILASECTDVIAAPIHYQNPQLEAYLDLPFSVSKEIERKITTELQNREERTGRGKKAQEEKRVVLTGRAQNDYSAIEKKIAEIWGSFMGFDVLNVYDNFYELGGDSRIAIRIANKLNEVYEISIAVVEILKYPTIEELAAYIQQRLTTVENDATACLIKAVEEKSAYPLSSAQLRVYTSEQIKDMGISYHIPMVYRISGKIDREKIERCFQAIIDRHEILRTTFFMEHGKVQQRIVNKPVFHVEAKRLNQGEQMDDVIRDFIQPFHLEEWPLIRCSLVEEREDSGYLLFDMHHIISDETSVKILVQEFTALYQGIPQKKLAIQYKDYAQWQKEALSDEVLKSREEFWKKQLQEIENVSILPPDMTQRTESYQGERFYYAIVEETFQAVKHLSEQEDATLFMVLAAVYSIVLSKYTGEEEIVIGCAVEGRQQVVLENMIGMFTNMIPLVSHVGSEMTFSDYLGEMKQRFLEDYKNADYPYEKIVDLWEDTKESTAASELFRTVLLVRNSDFMEIDLPEMHMTPYEFQIGASKYDITLEAIISNGKLELVTEYQTDRYKKQTIKDLSERIDCVLGQVVKEPHKKIRELGLMNEEQEKKSLACLRCSGQEFPQNETVISLFVKEARLHGERVALWYQEQNMTYEELNRKTDYYAHKILELDQSESQVVAVMVPHCLEEYICIFAILKAGKAYLPIDVSYPMERKRYLLEDSEAKLLLVTGPMEPISGYQGAVLKVSAEEEADRESSPVDLSKPHGLAYIIYTSGSTGKPKGAMLEHIAVVNRLNWVQHRFQWSEENVIMHKTPYTFDVSVVELFVWIFSGSSVCILPSGEEKDPKAILNLIALRKVQAIHFVPSMLRVFLDYLNVHQGVDKAASLETVFTSGEELKADSVQHFYELMKPYGSRLYNLYGPTEAAVDVTCYECKGTETEIPIGKPIDNTQILILDRQNKLCPEGVQGEICIAGYPVGRGYWNNAELTAQKFTTNPYYETELEQEYQRMYHTGDVGTWTRDGRIHYLGRMDYQVKIRGYRIELSEIEEAMKRITGIQEAVCIAKQISESGKSIVAYYVTQEPVSESELKKKLYEWLPDYMVPEYFMEIPEIPVGRHGKLDRLALPDYQVPEKKVTVEEPENEIEKKVKDIWMEILGLTQIERTDNFTQIGGNSITLVEMYNRIIEEFQVEVEIADIYAHPSIQELSQYLMQKMYCYEEMIACNRFPEEYMKNPIPEQSILTKFCYRLSPDETGRLKEKSEEEHISIMDFCAGVMAYLFTTITKQSQITLDRMEQDLQVLKLDFDSLEDTSQLFFKVKEKRENGTERSFTQQELSYLHTVNPSCQVSAVIENGQEEYNGRRYRLLYDICLTVKQGSNGVELDWRINTAKIKDEQAEEMADSYISILRTILEEE